MFKILEQLVQRVSQEAQDTARCGHLYHVFLQTREELAGYSVKVKTGHTVPIYDYMGYSNPRVVEMLRKKLSAERYSLGPWDETNKRFYATYITN
jgi:hypothetical protein